MKGGSRVSQMMQFLSEKQLSRCQVSRNEDNEPRTPGEKIKDLYMDNKPPPIAGCIHPFIPILSHALKDSLSVCIVVGPTPSAFPCPAVETSGRRSPRLCGAHAH